MGAAAIDPKLRILLERGAASDLEAIDPGLHHAVWKVYRSAIRERQNQRFAFDEALGLVSHYTDHRDDQAIRRLVAKMLTREPGHRV